MGISNTPDIFQSIIAHLLGDIPYVLVYIDDILITSNTTFTNHLQRLRTVLQRLEHVRYRANLQKCNFAAERVESARQ